MDGVRQRGRAALAAWAGLMLATWLVFAYGTDRPLKGAALVGAGFVYGVLVLGVSAALARLREKPTPAEPKKSPQPSQPQSRKKRRR